MTGSTDRPDFADPPETAHQVPGPSGPITVVEQGAGPTVLIVHGGSGDVTAWAQVAARLADGFRVLRYTRPLYRLDPPPTGARAVTTEVGDLLAVAHAAAAPVVLVGHSSGAVVALEAALAEPQAERYSTEGDGRGHTRARHAKKARRSSTTSSGASSAA